MARYFLLRAHAEGRPLNALQLQKYLYKAQGWALADWGQPLYPQRLEAWQWGPVVREVYDEYRAFGTRCPIQIDATFEELGLTEHERELLDAVYQKYRDLSGYELSQMSHEEAPWLEARGELPLDQPSSRPLKPETMKREFEKQLEEASADLSARWDAVMDLARRGRQDRCA